jgi:hypothetical protein
MPNVLPFGSTNMCSPHREDVQEHHQPPLVAQRLVQELGEPLGGCGDERRETAERERRTRSRCMGPLVGLPAEGVRPVLPPREQTIRLHEDEDA